MSTSWSRFQGGCVVRGCRPETTTLPHMLQGLSARLSARLTAVGAGWSGSGAGNVGRVCRPESPTRSGLPTKVPRGDGTHGQGLDFVRRQGWRQRGGLGEVSSSLLFQSTLISRIFTDVSGVCITRAFLLSICMYERAKGCVH